MTDMEKETSATSAIASDAMRELHRESTEATVAEGVKEINGGIKRLVTGFNCLHADVSALITVAKGLDKDTKDFVHATVALRHGDYGSVIRSERIEKNLDVEEAGGFAETVKYIMARQTPATRIRACIETNDKISGCIASWMSKIDKMRMRSSLDGSSQAELNMAAKRIVQFEEAVKTLRKRGGQVSDIFFATVRELNEFVAEAKRGFKVIYYNESTGKETK